MVCGGHKKRSNRLIGERSPYLLQHAQNPVDWYPWGEEAFERARMEDKPVFVSVGYFACHWCHVMAQESFEDENVASLLNEHFIPVKVDREERPDIDALYMRACQALTGSGGWPLTVVLTPDKKPFFAGTYIPKVNAYGRLGMLELLPRLRDMWSARRGDLLESAEHVIGFLAEGQAASVGAEIGEAAVASCYDELRRSFDPRAGGFGIAPKFPAAHNLMFLLRYHWMNGDPEALAMVESSLAALRMGGIHDHVGGGFHRYSTDAAWHVPHFEKMLYDQALIALASVEAWQVLGKPYLRSMAESTLDYVIRELTAPGGGFMSSEGADSPSGEGAFYAWTMDELRRELGAEGLKLMELVFCVRLEGNAEGFTVAGQPANILRMPAPLEEIASKMAVHPQDFMDRVGRILSTLLKLRGMREPPSRDDKVLADWNGLAIAAFSVAARAFGNAGFLDAARRAADNVLRGMRRADGRLIHCLRDAQEPIAAFADDYACMIWGLIELYQACFDVRYLREAIALNAFCMRDFFDASHGLFATPAGEQDLPVRIAESYDGAVPSANSIHIRNLALLARATGEMAYDREAWRIAEAFGAAVQKAPSGHAAFLSSCLALMRRPVDVIVAGSYGREDALSMLSALRRPFVPDAFMLFRDPETNAVELDGLSSFAKECLPLEGRATAYICKGRACLPPLTDREEALAAFAARE